MSRASHKRRKGEPTLATIRREQKLASAIRKARTNTGETTMAQAFRQLRSL